MNPLHSDAASTRSLPGGDYLCFLIGNEFCFLTELNGGVIRNVLAVQYGDEVDVDVEIREKRTLVDFDP